MSVCVLALKLGKQVDISTGALQHLRESRPYSPEIFSSEAIQASLRRTSDRMRAWIADSELSTSTVAMFDDEAGHQRALIFIY